MKIAVVGTGYVGLVSAVCLAELGHQVICIDRDEAKVNSLCQGIVPIYEPGIEELLTQQINNQRIRFATFDPTLIQDCDILMVAVWTPMSKQGGHADLSAVFDVVATYAPHLKDDTVIIVKSTVPIGTSKKLHDLIAGLDLSHRVHLASNPEFLREGSAINDFMYPDRIVVGASSQLVFDQLKLIYQPLIDQGYQYFETDIVSAEMIKYAANAFLATKITFINEMANLCEKVGGDINSIAQGMGLDQRIGPQFLQVGPGYGGSCFPKDTNALAATAGEYGVNLTLVNQTIASNSHRFDQMAQKIKLLCVESDRPLKIAFLGLSFKANTDDVRDSPAIDIINRLGPLQELIHVYDPKAHDQVMTLIPQCQRQASITDVLHDADLTIIATEWDEFKNIDPTDFVKYMRKPYVIDLRNLFDVKVMQAAGVSYHSLGRISC